MEGFLIFLLLIMLATVGVLSYVCVTLYRKVVFYERWYDNFAGVVESIYENLQQMDELGAFESDDEVGYFFDALRSMLMDLFAMGFYTTEEEVVEGEENIRTIVTE